MNSRTHLPTQSYVQSLSHSRNCFLYYSFTHTLITSLVHSLVYLLSYSFTHSHTHLRTHLTPAPILLIHSNNKNSTDTTACSVRNRHILVQYSDKFMHSIVKFLIVSLHSLLLCFCTVLLCEVNTIQCHA